MDESLKAAIDQSTVVSFDVFDTALVRSCARPVDVFRLVQERAAYTDQYVPFDFADMRIRAEHAAYQKAHTQRGNHAALATLADIYEELGTLTNLSPAILDHLMEIEQQVELALSSANPPIMAAYEYARAAGKEIYFVSDMYLPRECIRKLLKKAGYRAYTDLLVSSYDGAAKATGELYEHLLARCGVAANTIVHIGDSLHTDIYPADRTGLRTYHLPKALERTQGVAEFVQLTAQGDMPFPAAATGLIYGLKIKHYLTSTAPATEQFGYRQFGPLLLSFCQWLHAELRDTPPERVYFLARSGKIMQKGLAVLYPDQPVVGTYMLSSRRLVTFPAITTLNEKAMNFLIEGAPKKTVEAYCARINLRPGQYRTLARQFGFTALDQPIENGDDWVKLFRLLRALKQPILERAAQERQLLKKYLRHVAFDDPRPAAIVDIGWMGNIQATLQTMAGEQTPVTGYFFGLGPDSQTRRQAGHEMHGFIDALDNTESGLFHAAVWPFGELFELMFTNPEGSVLGITQSKHGFTAKRDKINDDYLNVLREIQAGAIAFLEDYRTAAHALGEHVPVLPKVVAIRQMEDLLRNPSLELAKAVGNLQHNDGFGGCDTPLYIAKPKHRLLYYVLKPAAFYRELEKVYWPIAFRQRIRAESPRMWRMTQLCRRALLKINRLTH